MPIKKQDFNLFRLVPYVLVLIFFLSTGFSQITWMRTYGGPLGNFGYSVQQTADGGYIVTGYTYISGNNTQVYLIKTDSLGDTLWTKTYGGDAHDRGMCVQQTTDGGYIITGYTNSFGDSFQIYLIKTDSFGDTLWTKVYGDSSTDYGYSVQQTLDGGFIIAAARVFGWGFDPVYLIKTDSQGNVHWSKTYGDTIEAIAGRSVQQTNDGGYIIGGGCNDHMLLIKTDSLGECQWFKMYRASGWYIDGYSVQQVNNGYILAGCSYPYIYLVRTDSLGDTLWTRTFSRLGDTWGVMCYSIDQTTDGGYILCGYHYYEDLRKTLLVRTDSLGDTLWTKIYALPGQQSYSKGYSVQQTSDGGYIVTGYISSSEGWKVYLIKTDQDGNVAGIEERGCAQRLSTQPRLLVYSNPFSGKTTIKFQILNPKSEVNSKSQTSLKIYDAQGRLVRQWGYKTIRQSDKITWDGTDDSGNLLSPGVYFCRLETNESAVTTKVIKLE